MELNWGKGQKQMSGDMDPTHGCVTYGLHIFECVTSSKTQFLHL